MSSSVHVDNKGKDTLFFGEWTTQRLDSTKLTSVTRNPISFTKSNRTFVLSLRCNGRDSVLFVDATKINQFKAKDSEIKKYPLCLGNASKDFTIDNMKENKIKRKFKFFSTDYRSINTNEILDIHKYLMKELFFK